MQSLGKTDPANIEVHIPDRTMTIQWGDGHRSALPLRSAAQRVPLRSLSRGESRGHERSLQRGD